MGNPPSACCMNDCSKSDGVPVDISKDFDAMPEAPESLLAMNGMAVEKEIILTLPAQGAHAILPCQADSTRTIVSAETLRADGGMVGPNSSCQESCLDGFATAPPPSHRLQRRSCASEDSPDRICRQNQNGEIDCSTLRARSVNRWHDGYKRAKLASSTVNELNRILLVKSVNAARRQNESLWRYVPANNMRIYIRKAPQVDGPRSELALEPNEMFRVSKEELGYDGILYLELADGRGWVFERKPDVGTMCIRVNCVCNDASLSAKTRCATCHAGRLVGTMMADDTSNTNSNDLPALREALATNELETLAMLLRSQQPLDPCDVLKHPWAKEPTTVGARAGIQIAMLAADDNGKTAVRLAGAIPTLLQFLDSKQDDRVEIGAVAINFISNDDSENVKAIHDAGGVLSLIMQCRSKVIAVRVAALGTLRNICMENDTWRRECVAMGIIKYMVDLLAVEYDPSLSNFIDIQLEAILNLQDMVESRQRSIIKEYALAAIECGAVEHLEHLLYSESAAVRTTAHDFLVVLQSAQNNFNAGTQPQLC